MSLLLDHLWVFLQRLWLLLLAGAATLLLIASALVIQQLPGQLNDDPVGAGRWLLGTSLDYGTLGVFLRGLGLFNVLHSVALQSLLALVTLIVLVQLARQVAAWQRTRQIGHLLANSEATFAAGLALYRWRSAQPTEPAQLMTQVRDTLATRFTNVQTTTVAADNSLLATRHLRWAALRPLLMLGLLLAVLAIWIGVVNGWEVAAPPLAPGENFAYALRQLNFTYLAAGDNPLIKLQVGAAELTLPANQPHNIRLAGVQVESQPNTPALWLVTDGGRAALEHPGEKGTTANVGLLFPKPGSEEAVLLPNEQMVLRLVRMGESPGQGSTPSFLIEIYRRDQNQPAERVQLQAGERATLRVGNRGLTVRVMALPGVQIRAQRMPGLWLLWPALALILLGGYGFWRQPAFLLAKLAPWPAERTVITVQSDSQAEVQALQKALTHEFSKTVNQ